MLEKVISGGQTGADQAGWRAAKAAGIPTGGWMPKGFLTEDGPRPEFAELYGVKEHPVPNYNERTISNIEWADMTLLFGNSNSLGARLAIRTSNNLNRQILVIRNDKNPPPMRAVCLIRRWEAKVLNIAGNRESKSPGVGDWVEGYLREVFDRLVKGACPKEAINLD